MDEYYQTDLHQKSWFKNAEQCRLLLKEAKFHAFLTDNQKSLCIEWWRKGNKIIIFAWFNQNHIDDDKPKDPIICKPFWIRYAKFVKGKNTGKIILKVQE